MDTYERSEISEPYERGGVQPRGGVKRLARRVVRNWERLVRAALEAHLEQSDRSDSDEGLDEDDDGFEAMVRRPPSSKRLAHERSKSYAVPPSLAAQTDIDALRAGMTRVRRRVVRNWERLVSAALETPSLAAQTDIDAVIEAADEIQKEDTEVARILFEYAYNLTEQMDPLSQGRGVLQFKSALKAVLMRSRIKHHIDPSQEVRLLTEYHTMLKERDEIEDLDAEEQAAREGLVPDENPDYQAWRAEKLRRFYETANILNNAANFLAALPACGSTSPSFESSNGLGEGEASESSLETKPSNCTVERVVKKYSWDQVLQMTEGLTSRELGKGGFGMVYLGKFENGREVAVKVLNQSSQEGKLKTFANEVNLLMQVNHVNLVKLLGYCQDERDVVIYEYVEEGSIKDHLHGHMRRLSDWKERLNIILQAACGIEYLHSLCSPRIIHRDIKSENILLTRDMVAKVADFGISRLMGGDEAEYKWGTHLTTQVMGSLGYLDPEYSTTGRLRQSSDVYSYGIVLLEMITGRKPVPNRGDANCCIGPWVKRNYGRGGSGAMKVVVDSSLSGNYNPKAMKLVIKLALSCIDHDGGSRPKMSEVVCVLQKALRMELEEKKSWISFY